MDRNSARIGIIAGVMFAVSSLLSGLASPDTAVAETTDEASPQPTGLGAVIPGEFIIQLENESQSDASGGSMSAQDVNIDTLRQRVDQVMDAVAAYGGAEVAANDVAAMGDNESAESNSEPIELASIFGFSAHLSPEAAQFVRDMDGVKAVFPNMELSSSTDIVPDVSAGAATTSWALDRIDQSDLPLDGVYRAPATGAGTNIYVVGTGFWPDHEQFAGRVGDGVDLADEHPSEVSRACFAAGTAEASVAAGATFGAATAPVLHSVRTLNCNGKGSFETALRAVDWIAAHAPPRSVVLFGKSGFFFGPMNDAIAYLDRLGITTVVPSNTESNVVHYEFDSCVVSPASAPEALTVGSSDQTDGKPWFSAVGRCIDMFAPGEDVAAAGIESPTATVSSSGNVTAAALVAGAVAMYLEQHADASPAQARAAVIAAAVPDRLDTSDVLAPNRLLNVSKMVPVSTAPPMPTPTAHIVQPSWAKPGDTVLFDGTRSRDANGGSNLTYAWRRSDKVGVVSTDPTMAVTFEYQDHHTVSLTVTDTNGMSSTTFVWIDVVLQSAAGWPKPIMEPSTNQSVDDSTTIEFDGSQSYDPDGGDLTLSWTVSRPDGSKEEFDGPTMRYKFFGQPNVVSRYTVRLWASDDEGTAISNSIAVSVRPSGSGTSTGDVVANQYLVELAEPSEMSGEDLHNRVESVMAQIPGRGTSTDGREADQNAVLDELESINGFSAALDATAVARLAALPEVRAVHPDRVYRTQGGAVAGPIADSARATTSWGLDRIDQTDLPGDGSYESPNDGAGTHVYIVDEGIWSGHSEFDGRLGDGVDVFGGRTEPSCFRHGTHVAGIAAGQTVGVASAATLHSVRVLGCDGVGTTAAVLAGIDWIVDNMQMPAVVNFSLSASHDEALNSAVDYLTTRGATVTAAASNDWADACPVSPGGSSEVITVAATDEEDYSAWFTNWGRCVELFAPGDYINSASVSGPNDYVEYSGTSMAAPFVAGAAALYLSRYPNATPAQVSDALQRGATADRVNQVFGDTPNLLLNISSLPAPDPTVVSSVPVARITHDGEPLAGREFIFDGRPSVGSTDDSLTYEWRVNNVKEAVGTGSTLAYTFNKPGEYRIGLRVTNGAGESSWTTADVDVVLPPPVLVLVPEVDQFVTVGESLTFDGSRSKAADGGSVTFRWKTSDKGVESRDAKFTRSFSEPGRVGVQLWVTDAKGAVSSKHLNVWVAKPEPPVLMMKPDVDQYVTVGESLTFDGSGSTDPDGGMVTYEWFTTGKGSVSKESVYTRSFPDAGRVGVRLVVTDDEGKQASKHVDVWVTKPEPPVVVMKPGVDQYVTVGDSLTFDGSGSKDPDGGVVTYEWFTTGKGSVAKGSTYTRSFPDAGRVGVQLKVTDDEGVTVSQHLNVWVSAPNRQDPVAVFTPGKNQTVKMGSSLTFDGSGSKDPDGGLVKFAWYTTGSGVVSRVSKYTRSFPTRGRFGVQLVVTDDEGKQAKKHIYVTVT